LGASPYVGEGPAVGTWVAFIGSDQGANQQLIFGFATRDDAHEWVRRFLIEEAASLEVARLAALCHGTIQ
jgi:hypothetical protein